MLLTFLFSDKIVQIPNSQLNFARIPSKYQQYSDLEAFQTKLIDWSINKDKWSDHLGHGNVRILEKGLPLIREFGDCSSIDNSMIASKANVDDISGNPLCVPPLGNGLQFTHSHDTNLRWQDQRIGHDSTDCADVRNANCAIVEFVSCEFGFDWKLSQSFDFALNVQ